MQLLLSAADSKYLQLLIDPFHHLLSDTVPLLCGIQLLLSAAASE
jgi:hypothetical protein